MYKYKYVAIEYQWGFTNYSIEEHRAVIDEHAENGWRFVSAIPTKSRGYGIVVRLDLVFEKDIKEI